MSILQKPFAAENVLMSSPHRLSTFERRSHTETQLKRIHAKWPLFQRYSSIKQRIQKCQQIGFIEQLRFSVFVRRTCQFISSKVMSYFRSSRLRIQLKNFFLALCVTIQCASRIIGQFFLLSLKIIYKFQRNRVKYLLLLYFSTSKECSQLLFLYLYH